MNVFFFLKKKGNSKMNGLHDEISVSREDILD